MKVRVRKAVLPVAGLGTRFLPITKATPKEMLPIVDKPLIQFAVEEAINAGIEEIIFVTSSSKLSIENHFDSNFELEAKLAETGKTRWLDMVRSIKPDNISCVYVRQPSPLGLGHAVLCARQLVGNEPFAVLLADDLIYTENKSCLQQMMEIFDQTNANLLAIQQVPMEDTNKYGIVALESNDLPTGEYRRTRSIVEKPNRNNAPSCFASIGRYILMPEVMDYLASAGKGAIGEIQLVDGIDKSIARHNNVYSYRFDGKRYDCGNKLGYLEATVEYALRHPEVKEGMAEFLRRNYDSRV